MLASRWSVYNSLNSQEHEVSVFILEMACKTKTTDKKKGADRQKGKTVRWKAGKGMRKGAKALK